MAEGYRTFGSYILFKEIASDLLGHLYRAGELTPAGLGRTVWLRILDGEAVPAADVVASFPTARRVAEVLRAANVASGASYLEHEGTPAVAADYQLSQPLNQVFSKSRSERFPVPVDNSLLILEKLALALSAAMVVEVDGESMIHGLLHPGLVLISTDGEAVLSGFGLAPSLLSMVDREDCVDELHPYLAPEVLLSRSSSKRGDVYSLGAILYELLCGRPLPPRPEERVGLLDDAQLAYDDRQLPEDIKAVLGRSIARRPEERYSSAADFKKELDKLLYGGAYSPTTFNLALFMDRLFRSEIESEEKERAVEETVDVSPYLAAEEPEAQFETMAAEARQRRPQIRWLPVVAAAIMIAAVGVGGWYIAASRGPAAPAATPTPTVEEEAARKREQEARLQALVQQMVQEKMAEKEEEIRQELIARQARIEDLQQRLRSSERVAKQRELSLEELRKQEELERQIAAEEQAQRQREGELERQRIAEESQRQTALENAAAVEPTSPMLSPTMAPPTAVPPSPTAEIVVTENSFWEPSQVDSMPVVLKDHPVSWHRLALHSRRQGVVIVQATVNADGRVVDVKVLRADHDGFGIPQSVMQAVRQYHFKPAIKNGVRVKSYATVTKRYSFRDR